MRIRAITLPLLAVAIGAAGCGSSSSSSSTATAGATGAAPATGRVYTVTLHGSSEVPKGSPTGSGTVKVTLKGSTGQVCWRFHVTGVPHATASHIHGGAAGVSGPVLVPLGAAYKPSGCTTTAKSLIAQIVATPSKYYVNLHTTKYPNGAVRAQL